MMFNGRWYAGRQLQCEFSPVTRWKTAICGKESINYICQSCRSFFILSLVICLSLYILFTCIFFFLCLQDFLTGGNVQKENTATSSMCSETQIMNSGRRIGIFICPLIAVEAFPVAIGAAGMECVPNVEIVLSEYPSAGGQIEGATAASGTVTGEDGAGRGGVTARRGGVAAERGGATAEGDTVEMGKSVVVAETGSPSNQ